MDNGTDRWLDLLQRFHRYEIRHRGWIRIRAVTYGVLICSLALLLFVLHGTPRHDLFWFALAAGGMLISLPPALCARIALRRIESRRNELARHFFTAGLRAEAGKLMTNVAHPRVVAALDSFLRS